MYTDAFYSIQKQYVRETNRLLLSTKDDVLLLKKLLQQNQHTEGNPADIKDGKLYAYYNEKEIRLETQSRDFYIDVKECDFFKEIEVTVSHIPEGTYEKKKLFSYEYREGKETEDFRLHQNEVQILDASKEINTFLIYLEDLICVLSQ